MSVPVIGSPEGFTPLVTAPTFPATTVWVQNTNPFDVVAYIGLPTVTMTHMYINSAAGGNSTTGAADLQPYFGAAATAASSGCTVIIPAGGWFRMDYSAGTPVWTWVGGV
jgi:hypothetical protein